MTVAELIEKLKGLPQDIEVVMNADCLEFTIRSVELRQAQSIDGQRWPYQVAICE